MTTPRASGVFERMRLSAGSCAIVLGLAWGGGCSEGVVEPSANPTKLRADLTVVNAVFGAPVVRSAGFFFNVLATPSRGGPLIPDSLRGKTFAWSCASQSYELTAEPGAPANGVRLRLYQLAANGPIACPATLIGQLDLFDVSSAATRAVRVTATGTRGDAFVDYTLTRVLADSTGRSTASGFVGDGHERLAFARTSAFTSETFSSVSTTQVDDSSRDFYVTLQQSDQMGVDTHYDSYDVTLRKNDLTLELKGSNGWANLYQSWDGVVTVNGAFFARISGHNGPIVMPPGLTNEERQLVLDVLHLPGALRSELGGVLAVAGRLVSAP